jgi:hypothetical protein
MLEKIVPSIPLLQALVRDGAIVIRTPSEGTSVPLRCTDPLAAYTSIQVEGDIVTKINGRPAVASIDAHFATLDEHILQLQSEVKAVRRGLFLATGALRGGRLALVFWGEARWCGHLGKWIGGRGCHLDANPNATGQSSRISMVFCRSRLWGHNGRHPLVMPLENQ